MKKRSNTRHSGQDQQPTAAQQALAAHPSSQQLARALAREVFAVSEQYGARLRDMLGVAQAALIQAAMRFAPSRGVPFTAFARPRVRFDLLQVARLRSRQAHLISVLWPPRPTTYGARQIPEAERLHTLKRQIDALESASQALPPARARLIQASSGRG